MQGLPERVLWPDHLAGNAWKAPAPRDWRAAVADGTFAAQLAEEIDQRAQDRYYLYGTGDPPVLQGPGISTQALLAGLLPDTRYTTTISPDGQMLAIIPLAPGPDTMTVNPANLPAMIDAAYADGERAAFARLTGVEAAFRQLVQAAGDASSAAGRLGTALEAGYLANLQAPRSPRGMRYLLWRDWQWRVRQLPRRTRLRLQARVAVSRKGR